MCNRNNWLVLFNNIIIIDPFNSLCSASVHWSAPVSECITWNFVYSWAYCGPHLFAVRMVVTFSCFSYHVYDERVRTPILAQINFCARSSPSFKHIQIVYAKDLRILWQRWNAHQSNFVHCRYSMYLSLRLIFVVFIIKFQSISTTSNFVCKIFHSFFAFPEAMIELEANDKFYFSIFLAKKNLAIYCRH